MCVCIFDFLIVFSFQWQWRICSCWKFVRNCFSICFI